MCGIVGVVGTAESFQADPELVVRMRDTMHHRGPDGAGTWIAEEGRVALGHRRLAIIDPVAAADQPMTSFDGRFTLVFNGEIYNHSELRARLEQSGVRHWRTDHSDTEVLLNAFAEWGIGCLDRLRGMFAFAVWDDRERELWLVRDRLGIKPLYFARYADRFAFASEIKAILADPQAPRRLDEESLFHYLSFLITPAPRTLFQGIRKLPPGTWMRLGSDGTEVQQTWWDVWDHVSPLHNASQPELQEAIVESLATAVSYRKVADVPVGVFLSGGVDSSTNAALFSRGEPEPIRTFSIGYERESDEYRNEFKFARIMADHVGAKHHERQLTVHDLTSFLPRMVELQDEPIADPVCVPVYYVSELARQHGVVVCQVGEGADELFGGYPSWMTSLALQNLSDRVPGRGVQRLTDAALRAVGRGAGWKGQKLRRAGSGLPIFWGGAEAFTDIGKQRVLSSRLRQEFDGLRSWDVVEPHWERFQESAWETSTLNWMSYVDLKMRLPELLLMRVDKMSMGVSLEARVPFLDHEFVALAMSIPAAQKIPRRRPKHLLKEAVRGMVPDQLIDRPKQGFGVPVHQFMLDDLGRVARDALVSFCDDTDVFDRTEILRLLEEGAGPDAWYVLNVALWWDHYLT